MHLFHFSSTLFYHCSLQLLWMPMRLLINDLIKIYKIFKVVKSRYNQGMTVQRSSLQEFLASTELPSANSQAAREIFATDQLLRLGRLQNPNNHQSMRKKEEETYF
jgi:hypothetical protein